MAFNLEERFPPLSRYYRLLDPGAYNGLIQSNSSSKCSKAPFLSNNPRNIQSGLKIYTHALYYADYPPKIQNCSTLKSKQKRFPYEIFTNKDLAQLLCRCGIEESCECSGKKEQVICQAKVRKRIFIGRPPRSMFGEGLSSPSKTDRGFKVSLDGKVSSIQHQNTREYAIYNTNTRHSTSFYHGCKWSKWTSSRSTKTLSNSPGPAYYTLTKKRSRDEICAETFRSFRRQTSQQLRFIEAVQQRDILEARPGPANYSPMLPKGFETMSLGQKSNRFPKTQDTASPGPANYYIQRDFDPIEIPGITCHAMLPEPSCFGVKALRFRTRIEEGPSPASYFPKYNKPSNFLKCSIAPFGVSVKRFKGIEEEECNYQVEVNNKKNQTEDRDPSVCVMPTWEFRSKTVRMPELIKRFNEPSPADQPQSRTQIKRSRALQYIAPFSSSEGRFQPWYNWIPLHGNLNNTGPCSYCTEKPKCSPAVHRGPLFRALRFPTYTSKTPASNKYNVGSSIESILKTHNKRLERNVDNQHKFVWKASTLQRKFSFEEQENLLLNRSIALLETGNAE